MIMARAVEIRPEGFTLASGRISNLYIDLRRLTQDPIGISLIGRLVLDKISELASDAEYVGGLETASIPISTAVCLLSENKPKSLKAFWVRKRQKDHGLENVIEGNLETNSKAVILDDTVTTGGSCLQAAKAVTEFGSEVVQAIAIVDRGARESFEKAHIPFFTFFIESDLI
jgi:orotate phosphoribosyltransferase